jgi:uncharacterized protein (DUF1800 family)
MFMHRRQLCIATLLVVISAASLYAKKQKQGNAIDGRKRAVQAINRLTFGPRPGDVQAVIAMGIDQWIDLQLHPQRIDDGALQARLAAYRTLAMSTREMTLEFPSNPVAKAVMDGKVPMPRDPYRHAIYVAAIDRIEQKQNPPTASNLQPADLSQRQPVHHEARSVVDDLIVLPPEDRMQRILDLPITDQRDFLQGVAYPKRQALLAGLTPEQREAVIALNHPEAVIDNEVESAKLLRAVYSDRQLEEVLTDFWFNHFNVFIGKGADHYMVTAYERDVIRPHVLGKFKDLLIATAQSPAMLFYLDNWQSEGPESDAALGRPAHPAAPRPQWTRASGGIHPAPPPQAQPNQQKRRAGLNENYARELMELHTLGVNGGYTQRDVTEVARVFTGWTLEQPQQGGGFVYRPRLHEPGDKVVLGHRIKEDGENEGLEVLELLARQPATAHFISIELAQRFVCDNPPPKLVDSMSKTFLKSDGDIRETLRTMLHSPEFWSVETYQARVKTPFEFVVSALRATQAEVNDPQPLLSTLNKMGEQVYGSQPPTGYSTRADVWVNSAALLDRMNFGLTLAANKVQGTNFDFSRLVNPEQGVGDQSGVGIDLAGEDPYQVQLRLEQVLLEGNISKQTHNTIEQRIVDPAPTTEGQNGHPPNVNVIAGLLLGSPEFQRK